MSKKAVCIGCNYPGKRGQLNGCVNDALWHQQFATSLGYQVTLLTDVGYGIYASKANIVQCLQQMVREARAGDNLYLSYSGHGTQVPDRSGQESDGLDEALCPADFHETRVVLLDDELDMIFSGLPQGCLLTCFFDCCHSGTIMDLDYVLDGTTEKKMKNKDKKQKKKDKKNKKKKRDFHCGHDVLSRSIDFEEVTGLNYYSAPIFPGIMVPQHLSPYVDGHIMMQERGSMQSGSHGIARAPIFCFAACRDDQSALDVSRGSQAHGLFTSVLQKVMQTTPTSDYSSMFGAFQAQLASENVRHDQNIQLSFNQCSDPNHSLFLAQPGPPINQFSGSEWHQPQHNQSYSSPLAYGPPYYSPPVYSGYESAQMYGGHQMYDAQQLSQHSSPAFGYGAYSSMPSGGYPGSSPGYSPSWDYGDKKKKKKKDKKYKY